MYPTLPPTTLACCVLLSEDSLPYFPEEIVILNISRAVIKWLNEIINDWPTVIILGVNAGVWL